MNTLNVNITPEEVLAQRAEQMVTPKKQVTKFDLKNYLNARLAENETSKTLTIRLLPFLPEGGSPFFKVHMHQVKVNKEVSPSGWKTFPCPIKNKLGDKCPFCETSNHARELKSKTVLEHEKRQLADVEFANRSREMWVVRCIERGHEEDGPKFWLFGSSKKGDGVYDKIMNIFTQRWSKAQAQGKYNNIFDLNEGKDLLITLTKDTNGKTVVNVADDDEKTPLSDNYDLALSWLNDHKKWDEVYTVKAYDYMSIIVQGGVPVYDKEKGCYVDKEARNAEREAIIEANLSAPANDLSLGEPVVKTQEVNVFDANFGNDDEDLPF